MTRRESQPQSESFIGLLGRLFASAKAKHNMKNRKVQLLCARMLCLALNNDSLDKFKLSPGEQFPSDSHAQQQVLEPLQAATRWDDTLADVEAGQYGTSKEGAQENPLLTEAEVGLLRKARVYVSSLAPSTKACLQNISAKWLSMANKAAFISHSRLFWLKREANTKFGEMIAVGTPLVGVGQCLPLTDKTLICDLRSLIIQATTDNSAVPKPLGLDSCHKEKVNREIEILEEALEKQPPQAAAAASPPCPAASPPCLATPTAAGRLFPTGGSSSTDSGSSSPLIFSSSGSESGRKSDSDDDDFYDAISPPEDEKFQKIRQLVAAQVDKVVLAVSKGLSCEGVENPIIESVRVLSKEIQEAPELKKLARMLSEICTATRDLPDGVSENIAIVMGTLHAVAKAVSEGDSEKLKVLISSLVHEVPLILDKYVSIEDYAQLLSDVAEIVPGSCPDAGVVDLRATAAEFSGFCAEIKAWKTEEGQDWINRYSACVDITAWEPSDAPDWLTKMQEAQDAGCSGSLTVEQVDCLLEFAGSPERDLPQLAEQLRVRSPGMR